MFLGLSIKKCCVSDALDTFGLKLPADCLHKFFLRIAVGGNQLNLDELMVGECALKLHPNVFAQAFLSNRNNGVQIVADGSILFLERVA